ncbi:DNA-3-methyladenine glycosylase I [Aureibacter tunicatorum]|uniref:DNA-3-methyladenine glycosylase I n=1 Tax=Aureibacter tunicatorum TaxID=866807 RepID=A0AAE3XM27_9BACT|nr:DNA-3-methyladenine glycosylase I [Aureibacter tunicatorum]MDR6238440.1 DNA-3-methyladenine glycosylase I [Aureibacter tunicatorum]
MSTEKSNRCQWCLKDDLYKAYHDNEWGKPLHDDTKLFEMLILEGAQAGLSWHTILIRRQNYAKAYDQWDYEKIAQYKQEKVDALLQDSGIIRNKLKVNASISNAQAFIRVRKEFGTFDNYIWSFTDGKTIDNKPKTLEDVPATSELSDTISKDLKKRGFKFVGSTICYAYMQAIGIVNDHILDCDFRE